MNKKKLIKTSKFLSLVLRHNPDAIKLQLDKNGRAKISELIEKMNLYGKPITRAELNEIVETNDKKRFVIEGNYIFAAQGHSIEVDVPMEETTPPDLLYHGTSEKYKWAILGTGINSQQRQHVHLSSDIKTAQMVGKRHGTPVVLIVLARDMHQKGMKFYLSKNGVWLTDFVPREYIIES